LHPQYANLQFFLFGESYAGHYVPAISSYIVKQNAAKQGNWINLQGIGIGDGLVDPLIQDGEYGIYALDNDLIDQSVYETTQSIYKKCESEIEKGEWSSAFDTCSGIISLVQQAGGDFNVYNIHLKCTYAPLCYNMQPLETMMKNTSLVNALGVQGHPWQMCDMAVYEYLISDFEKAYQQDIPLVLAAGVRVIAYSGTLDFICNYYGGSNWTADMVWPGQAAFNSTELSSWVLPNGTVGGQVKTVQNFTWLVVFNAGHMVPMDQPVSALAMVNGFMANAAPFNSNSKPASAENGSQWRHTKPKPINPIHPTPSPKPIQKPMA